VTYTDLERIEAEARAGWRGCRFPLRAYSEWMPPPYVGTKPYAPWQRPVVATHGLEVDEYEQAHDLVPGLDYIAAQVVADLARLVRGEPHGLSRTLLTGNAAWPDELAAAARAGQLRSERVIVIAPLALARTQDDKGNQRWTLFGVSHEGAGLPFWRTASAEQVDALVRWAGGGAWRVLAPTGALSSELAARQLDGLGDVDTLVTFEPFSSLPAEIRAAYLAHRLRLLPSPAALVFYAHPRYRDLAGELPRATQIPLLHLFPRVEGACAIRIPQSGWFEENAPPADHGHRIVNHIARSHRWQRIAPDAGVAANAWRDRIARALFSTDPDAINLYDKPMARNAEVWSEAYRLVLDGTRADRAAIENASRAVRAGGRFGYRQAFPPMRLGRREVFWHLPLIADERGRFADGPAGDLSLEMEGEAPLRLPVTLLARPEHRAAATAFPRDPGRPRHTTSQNVRKLRAARELLGAQIEPSFARALLRIPHDTTLAEWLDGLAAASADPIVSAPLVTSLRACMGPEQDPGPPLVLGELGTRAFEESVWRSIAALAEGEYQQKDNADWITVNDGKRGGPAAQAAHVVVHARRDLAALGDHLHARYRDLIAAHGMTGRAEVVDHPFRWETDFEFPWMQGWADNADAPRERNVVCMIPGRNRAEAVVMGDHYDTAYMEDVYEPAHGGDGLRAPARGADDNHSATTALLHAAEQLLPLARAGRLERDVWLVHLTGEEFPADCLGARAICRALVEGNLVFQAADGPRDVSAVRVVGAFVLDMIGHNTDRGRDVFQIAPGEGAAALRLARRAHAASLRWNRLATAWNRDDERRRAGRARRMPDGSTPPPAFAHLPLHGEVRVEWEPRSSLYNTDGQIFSDVGVPVVLFMENYDIDRSGYHDTHDTMANIDLDYCAALTAIAIETVADIACAREP